MIVELRPRTREHALLYFQRTQCEVIRRMLPSSAQSAEEALALFDRSLLPGATSFGRTIYAEGAYVGDVWCYCLQEDEPNAMLSYCIFEQTMWGQGIAAQAVGLFLQESRTRFSLESIGAFTYKDNAASLRVLEKCSFQLMEEFMEEGRVSQYWQRNFL